MLLDAFLQSTKSPWNLTEISFLVQKLNQEDVSNVQHHIHALENILIIRPTIDAQFDVDFIPDDILNYANFFFGNLNSEMPTYQEIEEKKIIEVLMKHGVNQPNREQIDWAFNNWLGSILDSKINIWVSHFYTYFSHNDDDAARQKIMQIIGRYLFNSQVSKNNRLLFFANNIAPEETQILMKKLLEEGAEIEKLAKDILG